MLLSFILCSLFQSFFTDATVRVDYEFSGNSSTSNVALSGLVRTDGWYGRRVNTDFVLLKGNGDLVVTDEASGKTLYVSSFSTLFTEWQSTDEAQSVERSFEHSVLIPMPKRPVNVELRLFDRRHEVAASHRFRLDPDDILIRHECAAPELAWNYLWKGGDSRRCIDVAIVAEGYAKEDIPLFRSDARAAAEAILAAEPFASRRDRFNIIAVECVSEDSGVSVPREGKWRRTAVSSHFDTFYSDRYLTTGNIFDLHEILRGIPYEHIIILANTDTYGGGGIYGSYTLTTAHHNAFSPVLVHEFGHSFGGLADEYFYEHGDALDASYDVDVEPWEPNITSLTDFSSKWEDLLPEGTQIPTPECSGEPERYERVGVYKGAGYLTDGMYRPTTDCRMRTNSAPGFCPVCRRALSELIDFYTVRSSSRTCSF